MQYKNSHSFLDALCTPISQYTTTCFEKHTKENLHHVALFSYERAYRKYIRDAGLQQ